MRMWLVLQLATHEEVLLSYVQQAGEVAVHHHSSVAVSVGAGQHLVLCQRLQVLGWDLPHGHVVCMSKQPPCSSLSDMATGGAAERVQRNLPAIWHDVNFPSFDT